MVRKVWAQKLSTGEVKLTRKDVLAGRLDSMRALSSEDAKALVPLQRELDDLRGLVDTEHDNPERRIKLEGLLLASVRLPADSIPADDVKEEDPEDGAEVSVAEGSKEEDSGGDEEAEPESVAQAAGLTRRKSEETE